MGLDRVDRVRSLFEGRRALAAIGVATLVFFALGVLVRYSFLQDLDLKATREFQERNWPALHAAMLLFTGIGSPVVLPIVGVVAAAVLWRKGFPRGAKLVLVSLLAIPVDVLLKLLWDSARPDAALVHVAVRTSGTSFPSGHATGSTALYGALAALAWIHLDGKRARVASTAALVLLPMAIDASRVYLGAHWLSDVIGGSAVGLLVLILLVRWYLGRIQVEPPYLGELHAPIP